MDRERKTSIVRIIKAFSWRNFPLDLKIIYLWLGLAVLGIFVPVLNESLFRFVFALPVVLFIPGYCLIAALFPGNKEIDGIERLALSFGLSIAIVPLIGFALNYTIWGIRLEPIIISLIIFTVGMGLISQYRRSLLAEEECFRVPLWIIVKNVKSEFFSQKNIPQYRALNPFLFIVLVLAICITIYAVVVPMERENFTEFYILGKNGTAADYPRVLFVGQPEQVIIGIGNQEYQNTTYFVELWMTNETFDTMTNTTLINQMEILDRFPVMLMHDETYLAFHQFTAPATGFNQLTFLLFKDAVPPDFLTGHERINRSYRNLQLVVFVRQPKG